MRHRFVTEVLRQWHFRQLLNGQTIRPTSATRNDTSRSDDDVIALMHSLRGAVGAKMNELAELRHDPLGPIPRASLPVWVFGVGVGTHDIYAPDSGCARVVRRVARAKTEGGGEPRVTVGRRDSSPHVESEGLDGAPEDVDPLNEPSVAREVGGVCGTSFATGWGRQKPDVPLCDPVQHDACAIQIRGERRNGRVFGARDGYLAVASPGRTRFSRNVKDDLRSPASRARKRLPSGVTAYCGRFADELTRVWNNGEGCRATRSRPDSTPTLIMVPSSAR